MTITFAIPQALQTEYCFRPGQHLTLKPVWAAKNCAAVTPFVTAARREISVAVKAIDGGRFSRYAQHDIQQGMELEVMVPQGISVINRRPNGRRISGDCRRLRDHADDGDH